MAGTFQLRVVTPDRTVIDREVTAVSFMGVDGSYGILARHAALLTVMKPGFVKITHTDGTVESMFASDGFAEMRDNVLSLICEAGELAAEIDLERARAAETRARAKLDDAGNAPGDLTRAEAEGALRRATLRQVLAAGALAGPSVVGGH